MSEEVNFNKKCPNYGAFMASNNNFCSLKCYEMYKIKQKGSAIMTNLFFMVR